jgi:glycosyltransferase involved in cell wall biosynthesis
MVPQGYIVVRILLLSAAYAPLLGGLQTAVGALTDEWQRAGHTVHVVTQRYPRHLAPFERIEGVPVWRRMFLTPDFAHLKRGRPDLFLAGSYYRTATQGWLLRKVREFQPDVLNMHFPDAQIPFVLALREKYSSRLVVSLHGHEILRWFDADGDLGSPDQDGKKLSGLTSLLQQADAVTACSEYLLGKAIQLVPAVQGKGVVTHNGVDLSRFEAGKAYSHHREYCLACGRLTHKKGFDLLIRAFAVVVQKHPELDLILAGEGEQRQPLEQLVSELGLIGRVIFFGRAAPEQVVELLLGCRFVVIPSRAETFGIVALEGMAAGRALVATRVGGLPEILADRDNRLVEPTVEGLAEGMEELLTSKDLDSIGKLNRILAENFSWEVAGNNYLTIFDTSLAKR